MTVAGFPDTGAMRIIKKKISSVKNTEEQKMKSVNRSLFVFHDLPTVESKVMKHEFNNFIEGFEN